MSKIDLSKESLFREAEKRTGLSEWGDTSFEAGLDMLLFSIMIEAELNPVGHFLNWSSLVRVLSNRLKLQADRYCEVPADTREMVFIVGLPRSGTTLLQRLLSLDPCAAYLRYCDVLFPAFVTQPGTKADAEKLRQTREVVGFVNRLIPALPRIHELQPDGPGEEIYLFEHQFRCLLFPLMMRVPSYVSWYLETDQHMELYQELKRLIAYIGQHRECHHWVLKTPQHLLALGALLEIFPNAKIIWLHRDPLRVVPSMCSLSWAVRRALSNSCSRERTGADWLRILEIVLERAMIDRKRAHERRFCDILYCDLIENPVSVIRRIYIELGMTFPDTMEVAIWDWFAKHGRSKHGRHNYSLGQFGLVGNDIKERFSDYIQQFNVPVEAYTDRWPGPSIMSVGQTRQRIAALPSIPLPPGWCG